MCELCNLNYKLYNNFISKVAHLYVSINIIKGKISINTLLVTLKYLIMKLKNIWRITLVLMILATSLPAISSNITSDPTKSSPAKNTELRTQQLMQRLEEIKASDKSELTRLEKKNLRKEVKEIKKEMAANKGGIYLSIGAVIIIILLLILLL